MPAPATRLPLDGDAWSLREAIGETWRWYVAPPAGQNSVAAAIDASSTAPGWLPARVPGSVVGALRRAGEVPDPYVARNSRAAEWTGLRSWVWRRPVELTDPAAPVTVELDGVDPAATIGWDGTELGHVEGLHHRHRLTVPPALTGPGTHWLTVVVAPVPGLEPQVGRTERVRLLAPRFGHGWDFCPPFPHQGLWRSARLVVGPVQLASVSARPVVDPGLQTARVVVRAEVELADGVAGDAVVRAEVVDPDGAVVATKLTQATEGRAELDVSLDRPRLWWPGRGPHPRYTVRVAAEHAAGRDECTLTTGFRRIEPVPVPDAPADALPYAFMINDEPPRPLAGWNWVPPHAQLGETESQRVEDLLDLAADSGAIVLRVWGGGVIESGAFYDGCDRRGLLVWQEFSQSSSGHQSAPAADEAFVGHCRDEARRIIPTRTHHPSLLLWCGGNELTDDGEVPLTEERSPVLAALRDTVRELDPDRAWLPTTPTGPVFGHRLDADPTVAQHDVHGPWEHQGLDAARGDQYALGNTGRSLAHTEFGVEGMTNRRLLESLLPQEIRTPTGRENPVYRHLGEWWNNTPLIMEAFGFDEPVLDGPAVEQLRRCSQLLQATGLAYLVEADLRRWPRCALVLPWQLNESFPNAFGTCVVDHTGAAKRALAAVARAFARTRCTVRVDAAARPTGDPAAEAWVWSFDRPVRGLRVALSALDARTGEVLARTVQSDADARVDAPRPAARLSVPRPDVPVLVWRAVWTDAEGRLVDDERMVVTTTGDWAPLLALDPAELDVTCTADPAAPGWSLVTVRHRGGPAALGVHLTDPRPLPAAGILRVHGDPRPVLPGETRTLRARWSVPSARADARLETLDPAQDHTVKGIR